MTWAPPGKSTSRGTIRIATFDRLWRVLGKVEARLLYLGVAQYSAQFGASTFVLYRGSESGIVFSNRRWMVIAQDDFCSM